MNEIILASHNKRVTVNSITYRIIAYRLGGQVLAQADPLTGTAGLVDLIHGRSKLAQQIRDFIRNGLTR